MDLVFRFRGTCHQSVTDFQFLVNKTVGRVLDVRHRLSPKVAMSLTNKASLGFIRKHLGQWFINVTGVSYLYLDIPK